MNLGVLWPKFLWMFIMPWILQYFWIIPICMGSIITIVETEQTSMFTWNRSNPLFTDEDGAKLSISIGSNFKIICPQQVDPAEPEYYAIYWVSQKGYDECFLPNDDKKVLVICNKPFQAFDFTVEITIFSSTPGGIDFKIGESYYIASFSTGTLNGLSNQYHGACQDYNMKLNLTVTDQQLPPTQAPGSTPRPTTDQPHTPTPWPKTTTPVTTPTPTTTTAKTTPKPSTARPPYTTDIPDPTDNTAGIINVPDNGNTGVIDITNSARTLRASPIILLSACLSLLHILYRHIQPYIVR